MLHLMKMEETDNSENIRNGFTCGLLYAFRVLNLKSIRKYVELCDKK